MLLTQDFLELLILPSIGKTPSRTPILENVTALSRRLRISNAMAQQCPTRHTAGSHAGYCPSKTIGMIGNMHTCALIEMNGSVDFMYWKGAISYLPCPVTTHLHGLLLV